jgi:1-deoxy-D-xylulose-5-phosphate synthase
MFPKRFFDVGIAEEYAVTFAAGMAKQGYIPVFAVYSTFLQRAYDQIIHDVCIQNLHVIFAIDRAGLVGDDGETHQGIYDVSFLAPIPNLVVMAPKNGAELEAMLDFAVAHNGPVAIRYPRGASSQILKSVLSDVTLGKSETVYDGTDIALVSYGAMMDEVLIVYEDMISKGYNPKLINARFASPMDAEMIDELVRKFKYVFTFEDNIYSAGFGCLLTQKMAEKGINDMVIHNFSFRTHISNTATERFFLKGITLTAKVWRKKYLRL